jgi:hypothetical protein
MMTNTPVSCSLSAHDERSSLFDQSGVAAPPITSQHNRFEKRGLEVHAAKCRCQYPPKSTDGLAFMARPAIRKRLLAVAHATMILAPFATDTAKLTSKRRAAPFQCSSWRLASVVAAILRGSTATKRGWELYLSPRKSIDPAGGAGQPRHAPSQPVHPRSSGAAPTSVWRGESGNGPFTAPIELI